MVITKQKWLEYAQSWLRTAQEERKQGASRAEIFKSLNLVAECRRRYHRTPLYAPGLLRFY